MLMLQVQPQAMLNLLIIGTGKEYMSLKTFVLCNSSINL